MTTSTQTEQKSKKIYTTPKLMQYGTVAGLTQAGIGSKSEDGNMGSMKTPRP